MAQVQGSTSPYMLLAALSEKLRMCWTGKVLLLIFLPLHYSRRSPTMTRTLSLDSPGSECLHCHHQQTACALLSFRWSVNEFHWPITLTLIDFAWVCYHWAVLSVLCWLQKQLACDCYYKTQWFRTISLEYKIEQLTMNKLIRCRGGWACACIDVTCAVTYMYCL